MKMKMRNKFNNQTKKKNNKNMTFNLLKKMRINKIKRIIKYKMNKI